jgi:hypothetical protein
MNKLYDELNDARESENMVWTRGGIKDLTFIYEVSF